MVCAGRGDSDDEDESDDLSSDDGDGRRGAMTERSGWTTRTGEGDMELISWEGSNNIIQYIREDACPGWVGTWS